MGSLAICETYVMGDACRYSAWCSVGEPRNGSYTARPAGVCAACARTKEVDGRAEDPGSPAQRQRRPVSAGTEPDNPEPPCVDRPQRSEELSGGDDVCNGLQLSSV